MDSLTGRVTFSLTFSIRRFPMSCMFGASNSSNVWERKKDAHGQSNVHTCTPLKNYYIYIYSIDRGCFLCQPFFVFIFRNCQIGCSTPPFFWYNRQISRSSLKPKALVAAKIRWCRKSRSFRVLVNVCKCDHTCRYPKNELRHYLTVTSNHSISPKHL